MVASRSHFQLFQFNACKANGDNLELTQCNPRPTMTPIETLIGEVNLRYGSAKAFVFYSPRIGGAGAAEQHLGIASKSPQTAHLVRKLSPFPTITPSVSGYAPEVGGKMIRTSYEVANGEILKVFGQRRAGAGKLTFSACQFLRVRDTAALVELTVRLLSDPSVVEPYAKIVGRFDLITLDEAKSLGIKVLPHFEKMFSQGVVEDLISIRIIDPEKAKVETVSKDDGTTAMVTVQKRRRFIKPI